MLLEIYKNLKTVLNTIDSIQYIDWFNDQYSGTIHTVPAVFIEFPNPLLFETLSKEMSQADLTVKLHIVSKALSSQTGSIQEGVLIAHENINNAVFKALQGVSLFIMGLEIHNSLNRTNYEHHQYMKGWLVTTQEFECELYQYELPETTESKPEAEINSI